MSPGCTGCQSSCFWVMVLEAGTSSEKRASSGDKAVTGSCACRPITSAMSRTGTPVTILYDEPRVLVAPLDHRLAGKEHVTLDDITLDDIADEPLPPGAGVRPGLERLLAHRPPT
jgi:hypothetical protein